MKRMMENKIIDHRLDYALSYVSDFPESVALIYEHVGALRISTSPYPVHPISTMVSR
jgi:hypothetical protein